MGIFNIFKKKDSTVTNNNSVQEEKRVVKSMQSTTHSMVRSQSEKKNLNSSVKSISEGAVFDFEFASMSVVKQYYNDNTEKIDLKSPLNVRLRRTSSNGEVHIIFSNLEELKIKGIIQQNLILSPQFTYQSDYEGNEFASAEINNRYEVESSTNECISLFQITKQNGKIISFLINNLPGEDNFYYLLVMGETDFDSQSHSARGDVMRI